MEASANMCFRRPSYSQEFFDEKGGHNFYLKAVPFLEGKHETEESNSFQRSQQREKLSGSVTLTSASTAFDRPLYRRRLTEGFDPSKATHLKERRHEIDQTRLLYRIKKTKRSTVRGRGRETLKTVENGKKEKGNPLRVDRYFNGNWEQHLQKAHRTTSLIPFVPFSAFWSRCRLQRMLSRIAEKGSAPRPFLCRP